MNREEILAKAQKETDERELTIKNKAYKYASEVMTTIVALIGLFCAVDGFLLENVREFGSTIIAMAVIMIALIYYTVYEGYVAYQLKEKKNIFSFVIWLLFTVALAKMFLSSVL